ncbi:hypothetical protein BXY85_3325 [Roseivirga pacifica]|uniref:Uncharacterized protein n=1 Tax=Roseivirga pacifica TaxID=1267423 RepID=A0A1I0QPI0_9BACT|nr:hypothetical protein [Roseivirga pacifica]RKQ42714.1 hypothetical protein BXY85_3325 [Roseivirga pacifica]SEW29371.1 hypothetical protein SAMN05216290_2550 [Roseivirga pacifica]
MKLLITLTLVLFTNLLLAQKTELSFTNSFEVNEEVYKDIKGTPYLFDDWKPGKIYSFLDTLVVPYQINYNGFTKAFEIKNGDRFINLDDSYYKELDLDNAQNPDYPYHFSKFGPKSLGGRWVQVIHEGPDFSIYLTFEAAINESQIQDVGKTLNVKSFTDRTQYYIYTEGKVEFLKMKKKELRDYFGKKLVDGIIKENKLDLDEYVDQVKLFALIEQN